MRTKTNTGRRHYRRTNSTASKIVSAGLATATCVGLVGVIGVRTAQDSAAADSSSAADSSAAAQVQDPAALAPTTSDGYTQADLDAYAAQLDAEAQRLADYRSQLVDAALALQQSAGGPARVTVRKPAAVPSKSQGSNASASKAKAKVSRPAAQPAPKPQPQSSTKSS